VISQAGRSQPGDDSLFVVLKGRVELAVPGAGGGEDVEPVRVGGLFGGVPLVTELPTPFTTVADGATTLLEIDRMAFSHLERAQPSVAKSLSSAIVGRVVVQLRSVIDRLAQRR
jgi:signal-transduction protein with cAMP-binding, CBS, and nucleotidyltransferase domain